MIKTNTKNSSHPLPNNCDFCRKVSHRFFEGKDSMLPDIQLSQGHHLIYTRWLFASSVLVILVPFIKYSGWLCVFHVLVRAKRTLLPGDAPSITMCYQPQTNTLMDQLCGYWFLSLSLSLSLLLTHTHTHTCIMYEESLLQTN